VWVVYSIIRKVVEERRGMERGGRMTLCIAMKTNKGMVPPGAPWFEVKVLFSVVVSAAVLFSGYLLLPLSRPC
jgi:hypothetical protein